MPLSQLSRELATTMQEFTQQGCAPQPAPAQRARGLPRSYRGASHSRVWHCCSGVRPFGVSLLAAGYDDDGPHLYQIDPSGSYWAWKASAIGKNMVNAKTFLEKRYNEDIEIEDAIHTAILTLKEGFEGQMTEHNIELAVVGEDRKLKILTPAEIKDYLAEVE